MNEIKAGAITSWTRTITEEDIRRFAQLSGDKGTHHLQADEKGRLMAHGLLTATLPTKLGGDMNYIARTMFFKFLRPVYAGDTLVCGGKVEAVAERPHRWEVDLSFSVTNQHGKVVLKGTTSGIILRGQG